MSAWRELTNEELFELSQSNEERCKQLTLMGATISGVQEHYLLQLLETIAGERMTDSAREKHHIWLRNMLDEVEPQVTAAVDQLQSQARTQRLLDGVAFGNGRAAGPEAPGGFQG